MITSNFTVRVLQPSEGKFLTQSESVSIENRIITDKVYLGVNASENDWVEITAEEVQKFEKEREEFEKEMQNNIITK